MSKHPLNLFIRLLLEVAALVITGIWGYHQAEGVTAILMAIILPVLFAAIWGIFAVMGDPSRSGKTVVPTHGIVRLLIEFGLFGFAVWAWFDLGFYPLNWIFLALLVGHYSSSYDRIIWLVRGRDGL